MAAGVAEAVASRSAEGVAIGERFGVGVLVIVVVLLGSVWYLRKK